MFDLSDLNPAQRFSYPDSKEEWVELRLPSDEDQKKFFKVAGIKAKKEYHTDKKTRGIQILRDFEPSDEEMKKYEEEMWDFCITDWNLITKKKEKIPCTKENKCKLMFNAPQFAVWVKACQEKMYDDLSKIKEALEKN